MAGRDRINLRVCAVGAGLVHAICLAAVLPILITLPAPQADGVGSNSVAIDVEIIEAERVRLASIDVPTAPLVEQAPALPVEPIIEGEGDADPEAEAEANIDAVEESSEVEEPRIEANEPAPASEAIAPEPFESSEITISEVTSALPLQRHANPPAEPNRQDPISMELANLGIGSAASAAADIEREAVRAAKPELSAPLPKRKPTLAEREKRPAKLKRPAPKQVTPIQAKPAKPKPRVPATAKRKSEDVPYKGPVSGMFAPAPKAGDNKLFQSSR